MSLLQRQLRHCGQSVSIQTRNLVPPVFGSVDPLLNFVEKHNVKALIRTPRGKTLFDGVSIDQVVTHKLAIEYLAGITSEDWILFNGRRLDILDVENCGETNQALVLTCNDRGTKEASKA